MHRTANPFTPVRFRSWPPFHEPVGIVAKAHESRVPCSTTFEIPGFDGLTAHTDINAPTAANQGIRRRTLLFISAGINTKYIALMFLEIAPCDTAFGS